FGAWQRSIQFLVTPVHDALVDGDRAVTISALAPGYRSDEMNVTVLDADVPELSIELDADALMDGDSIGGRVTTKLLSAEPRTVQLSSTHPGRLILPPRIIIKGGEVEALFTVETSTSSRLRGFA